MILLFVVHLKKKTRDKVSAIYDFKYFEWYLLFKKKKREIHACSFVQLRSRSKRFREGTRNEVYEFSRHRAEFRGEINGDPWLRARTFLRCEGLPRFSTAGGAEVFFGGGNVPAFRTPVFSRVIRLIMFYYRVERFVRSNYFKIREWKIDEIEAIFTPASPRPLLRLGVDIKL